MASLQSTSITGSLYSSGSVTIEHSGGVVFDVQGSQGQLFSITDDLEGSLFSVSDISGIPILDVSSDGTVEIDGTLSATTISGVVSSSAQVDYNSIQNKPTIPTNNNQLTNGAGYTTCVGDITGVTAGTCITGGGTSGTITINHSDTSTLSGAYGTNGISSITVDSLGHVTSVSTATYCITDTTYSAATMLTCIKSVDGASSGLDADLLDGVHGASFLRSDTADTATGALRFQNDLNYFGIADTTNEAEIVIDTGNAGHPQIGFTDHNDASWAIGVDDGDNSFKIHGAASATIPSIGGLVTPLFEVTTTAGTAYLNGSTIWHAGNDGASSGLDADLLDGNHASAFYLASNPSGYTTCVGDITGVTAGTGLSGGGTSGTVTVNLSHLGIQSLADPNADRIFFWDDSAGTSQWLSLGTNLSISGTTLNATDTNTTYSAATMLTCIKSVDGASSGLDADLLDGNHASAFYLASNPSGYTTCTGTQTGTGTSGYISKWNGSTSQTNSTIYENGTTVGIGTTASETAAKLLVGGSISAGSGAVAQFNGFIRLTDFVIIQDSTCLSDQIQLRYDTTTKSLMIYPFGTANGDVIPQSNGTQNLGSSTLRWNTVYTSDLSLKNDVGDWTIVEGEEDLFLYNNKKDKVYKFNLTEVDKESAPKKRS